jgi:hypothetical protein
MLTVTPAHGRDYKTAKQARESWNAGRDWIVSDFFNRWDGKPINNAQADSESITLRFCNLTKIVRV